MKTAIDPGQPLEPVLASAGLTSGAEIVPDLPPPPAVDPERYKIDWYYATSIITIHLLGLLVFVPWLFSWTGVFLLVLGIYFYGGVGINMCYHRLLTHKSFKCPQWLERFMVVVAACCMEDSPGRWVTTHRLHHNESDQPPDPHSPRVSFFWSHMGWLLVRNPDVQNIVTFDRYSRDIMSDPFYMRLERGLLWFWIYQVHALAYLLLGTVAGWFMTGTLMGAVQFGLSVLVWGVFARTVAVWHITWSVNSLSHMFGYRNYETNEGSRNNWLVAFLTSGEGWHNNHHGDPASATTCHRWWEIDGIYWGIKALEMVGLAWDVVPPRYKRQSSR